MYRVTYSLYRRYQKERMFEDYEAAKRFFYGYCVRNPKVGNAELKVLEGEAQ